MRLIHYFAGESKHSTHHKVTTCRGIEKVLDRTHCGDGWGARIVLSHREAKRLGAYETKHGDWGLLVPWRGFVAVEIENVKAQAR